MHWSIWLVVRVAGLATGISAAVGLWLAFLLTKWKPPFGGVSWPVQLKALLSAPIVFYWLGAGGVSGGRGFWPLTQTAHLPITASK